MGVEKLELEPEKRREKGKVGNKGDRFDLLEPRRFGESVGAWNKLRRKKW